jgi:hypothetical protein
MAHHLGIPKAFVLVKYLKDSINGRRKGEFEAFPCDWFTFFGNRDTELGGSHVKFICPDPTFYEAHTVITLKGKSGVLPPRYKQLECSALAIDFASTSCKVLNMI